jgi:hypothetical protein
VAGGWVASGGLGSAPSDIQQDAGLKYSDDGHDARWRAHLVRLGRLPQGDLYPQEARAVRDLLRQRRQLVRQRSRQGLSLEHLVVRNTGRSWRGNEVKRLTLEAVPQWLPDPRLAWAVTSRRGGWCKPWAT